MYVHAYVYVYMTSTQYCTLHRTKYYQSQKIAIQNQYKLMGPI